MLRSSHTVESFEEELFNGARDESGAPRPKKTTRKGNGSGTKVARKPKGGDGGGGAAPASAGAASVRAKKVPLKNRQQQQDGSMSPMSRQQPPDALISDDKSL